MADRILQEEPLPLRDELRRLEIRHRNVASRVEELERRSYLSAPEQLERVNLKKKKLQIKDRMMHIARRQRAEA